MNSLGTATTQFGFDLFQELNKTKEGNIFFSPVSITTAIGMLFLGARGATAAQLQEVGGLPLFARRGLVSGGSLLALPGTYAPLDPWGRKQRERVKTWRVSGLPGTSPSLSTFRHAISSLVLGIPLGEAWVSGLVQSN